MADDNNQSSQPEKKRPNQIAYVANEGKDGKSHFTKIGATFAHKDGKGQTLNLNCTPVDGKVVLRDYVEKLKNGERPAPQQSHDQER